jgi:hypothetical protein
MSEANKKKILDEVAELSRGTNIITMPHMLKRLRTVCKEYSDEELQWALDAVTPFEAPYHQVITQEIEARRHKALTKDSWTQVPTFWLVLIGAIAGVVAAVIAVISCFSHK